MKYLLMALCVLAISCNVIPGKRIDGNGVIKKETRDISGFRKIEVEGDFEVEIRQAEGFKVEIEADDNLLAHIRTRKEGGALNISEEDGYGLDSDKGIRVVIQLPLLDAVSVAGSGSVKTVTQFENPDKMRIDIGGSGDVELEIKSPRVILGIGGSGKAKLTGITRDLKVSIGGSGDCLAEELLSEECEVSIGGSGTARVFSSVSLEASIGGSGNIYYGGNPQNVKKSISGGGTIEQIK